MPLTLRLTIILLFQLLWCDQSDAQDNWLRRGGGNSLDELLDIYSTPQGGYVTGGHFSGNALIGGNLLISTGQSDALLMHFINDGQVQWVRKYGGLKNDRVNALATDALGNIFITGFFTDEADFGGITLDADSGDVFVAKVSATGNMIWAVRAGGIYSDAANGIATDNGGNVIITGQFRGTADFGPFTINGSGTSAESFVAKLDASGNWLWAKGSNSPGVDRGMDVCADASGNVYVCGQFSDDIDFDVPHTNDVENAGYLIKFNSSGSEQWFSSIVAGQLVPYGIACDSQNRIWITGESSGQILFFAGNTVSVPFTESYSIFLAQYSAAGMVNWAIEDGSQNLVSARDICIGTQNDAYITGTFRCDFTEYSEEAGDGLFVSAGFRDVFLVRYNADGERIWVRQTGGPRDDFCSAVAPGNGIDKPVIAGSFEKFLHVPANSDFTPNSTLWFPQSGEIWEYPNEGGITCGQELYSTFQTVEATGNKDLFYTSLYNPDVGPYLFYTIPGCDPQYEEPCIGLSNFDQMCDEDVQICEQQVLYFNSNTGTSCFIGPEYEVEWNTGSEEESIEVDQTGWYWVTMSRVDGCYSETDSIFAEVNPIPVPWITDSEGINVNAPPDAQNIVLCAPATVQLEGGNVDGNTPIWNTPDGAVNGTDLTVSESGQYIFTLTDELGCTGLNEISVSIVEPLDTISPVLTIQGFDLTLSDTVQICEGSSLNFDLNDLLLQDLFEEFTDSYWEIYMDGQLIAEYEGQEAASYEPIASGWMHVTSEPFLITPPPCEGDTVFYPALELEFFVDLLPAPALNISISGETDFCPGDTLSFVVLNAPNVQWGGPGIIAYPNDSTILVDQSGTYTASSSIMYENGCNVSDFANVVVEDPPQPLVFPEPEHGIICPGDSVLLVCEEGLTYQWVGPLGQNLGNTQSIYASQPGNYYCLQTNFTGCSLESNVVELQVYSTPFLMAFPSSDLCATGFSTLFIQTYPGSEITWQAPLSGNGVQQTVFNPGLYTVQVEFCDIVTEATVEVTETVLVPVIEGSTVLCPGETSMLAVNNVSGDYQWNPEGQNTASIVISQAGIYSVQVTDTLGCEGTSAPFVVTDYALNPPAVNDVMICLGESAQLVASGAGEINWYADPFQGQWLGSGSVYQVDDVMDSFVVFITVTDDVCTSISEQASVTIWPSSIPPVVSGDTTYCGGTDIVLDIASVGGVIYQWQLPGGGFSINDPLVITQADGNDSGDYSLLALDGNCESTTVISVLVENPFQPDLLASSSDSLCIGSELMLQPLWEGTSYQWSTPNGTVSSELIQIEETDLDDAGLYTLQIPGVYCETNYDTVLVSIIEYPEINLEDTMVYCDGGYMITHLPSGYDQYLWSNGDTGPESIVPVDGNVLVTVTNFPGCSTTDSIKVSSIDCITDFPNVFTPNGDQYNPNIDFGWLRIPIDEVLIYNRWGNLVRHLTSEPWIWRGETDWSTELPDGVYYYIVKSPNPGKQFPNLSGYLHLFNDDTDSGRP